MDKDALYHLMTAHVQNPGKRRLGARVLGYMSKVIPEPDRIHSIWRKEASALINALGKFKPLIELAPAVVCLVDSQVVYFLSHNNLLETNLKAKRLGTLLHLEYPNIIVAPISGKANISDKLSRLFSLPKIIADSISLKNLKLPEDIPELENKAYSIEDAREAVTALGNLHHDMRKIGAIAVEEMKDTDQPELIDASLEQTTLTVGQKSIYENFRPIRLLAQRLAPGEMSKAQKQYYGAPEKESHPLYEWRDDLCYLNKTEILRVPPSLEGVVLSHAHLLCGHVGWHRLHMYVSTRYMFPKLREKCYNLATTCQICMLANPGTRRLSPQASVLASYPMEIVTADLLEIETIAGKRQHKVLVNRGTKVHI